MSLILEALKKSEAERRLGRAPGLMTPVLEPVRERSRFGLVLTMLAVAGVAAGGAWWMARRDVPVVVQEPVAVPAPAVVVTGTRVPDPEPAVAVAREPATAPAPATRRETVVPRSDPAFAANAQERESRAMPASDNMPPPMLPAPALDRAAPARSEAARVAPPPAPAPTPPPEPVAEVPAEPYVPSLAHLPASERQDLPPLRLSMHVFNEVPANRFVIIDGRRYGEGQSITQGLVVANIRRDGVVLERSDQRFLLPRP
jgi:general secretion pathway protein B